MGVTRTYDQFLDEWVIRPVMRYSGGTWIYDQRAKVYDEATDTWVPMNGPDPCIAQGGILLQGGGSLTTQDGDCIIAEDVA